MVTTIVLCSRYSLKPAERNGHNMKKLSNFKGTLYFLGSGSIAAALTLEFLLVWHLKYNMLASVPLGLNGSLLLSGIYVLMVYLFTMLYGGYKIGYYRYREIVYSQGLSLFMVNFITYFQVSLFLRQFVDVLYLFLLFAVQLVTIAVWTAVSERLYFSLYPPRNTLAIFENNSYIEFVEKVGRRADRYRVSESVSVTAPDLLERILDFDSVLLCDISADMRNTLLKHCYRHSKEVYLSPKSSDIILGGAEQLNLFDTPMMLCRGGALTPEERFVKRAMDIVISSVAIVLSSPLLLGAALAVKLYDGGPALFSQERATVGGRVFKLYKLRSMVVNAEKHTGAVLSTKGDPRVTPIGRFIRAVRLDELPQLFNVLKGDMSIVGPRPERPELAAKNIETLPEFDLRLKVKAGLTGYAQVLGKYNTTPQDKLKLDLMYIGEYSVMLDVKIMLMTVKILFMKSSTEGV